MAVTAIADIIDPEVLADQVSAKYPDMLTLSQVPGLIVTDTFANGTPGTVLEIPFWKRMGALAAYVEGTPATEQKLTTGRQKAVIQRAIGVWSSYDTASLVSKADPLGEIADQISRRVAEYIDNAVKLEADKTPNSYNHTAVGAGTMEPNAVIKGLTTTIGDSYASMVSGGAIFMHSKVFGDLLQLGEIKNDYQSGMGVLQTGMVGRFLGMPVFLSDLVTTATVSSVLNYNTYVVGPEALGLFYQRQVNVERDRDILVMKDLIQANVHFAPHLFGYDAVGAQVVAEQNKSIAVVKIVTK